ncbi:MAG: SRPBCC family protein [Gemmatimonadales bacterium]
MQTNRKLVGVGGIGLGGALMYFLDPDRGAGRRQRVRDQVVHAGRVASEGLDTTMRDLGNRAQGLAARARSYLRTDEADDRVIEERVRAELGRVVSHPSAIAVASDAGRVTLRGPVLAREADALLPRVRQVRGVTAVEDRLELHATAGGMPALQGGTRRTPTRFELQQENWAPAARLLTSLAGGAAALYGVRRRHGVGSALGLAGLALLARGATKIRLERLVRAAGGRRAVDLQKTVTIDAPPARVYAFLTEWEQWPQWMSHVREVTQRGRVGGRERTHWVVDGPLGVPVSWDAITTNLVPNEEIAWKTVAGAAVEHAGVIRLAPTEDGSTRVQVWMAYNPPAGVIGHAVAASFGRDPRRQMDADLARLKTTVETGRPPRDAARLD